MSLIEIFVSALVGALMSLALATGIQLWEGRGRRHLYGEWRIVRAGRQTRSLIGLS